MGMVFELGDAIHESVFYLSILWKVFAFAVVLALPPAAMRCQAAVSAIDSDGPDIAQQFAPHRGDDLALVLACHRQTRVALVQSVLRFLSDLFDLFRHALLSLAQRWPDP